ncbi:MAG: hypothetical protein AAFQ20_15330, partial [Bacteroidota bacterium]
KNVKLKFARALFKKLVIPFPPLDEQVKIVEEIENINEVIFLLIEYFEKKLNNVLELKKSILQKAFSGALTSESSAAAINPIAV